MGDTIVMVGCCGVVHEVDETDSIEIWCCPRCGKRLDED
jgi:hypothetical protein